MSLGPEIHLFFWHFPYFAIFCQFFSFILSFIQLFSKIYSFKKLFIKEKIFLIHSKKLFIQEISTLFIQTNYSFNLKMDYRPWLVQADSLQNNYKVENIKIQFFHWNHNFISTSLFCCMLEVTSVKPILAMPGFGKRLTLQTLLLTIK